MTERNVTETQKAIVGAKSYIDTLLGAYESWLLQLAHEHQLRIQEFRLRLLNLVVLGMFKDEGKSPEEEEVGFQMALMDLARFCALEQRKLRKLRGLLPVTPSLN